MTFCYAARSTRVHHVVLRFAYRAQKLIAGLGGEKNRWTAAAERLGQQNTQLTGDVLLAAAQIAYLGAFTSSYRSECLEGWVRACTSKEVPCSEKFKLAAVLGDPVKVCGWTNRVTVKQSGFLVPTAATSPQSSTQGHMLQCCLHAGSSVESLGTAQG